MDTFYAPARRKTFSEVLNEKINLESILYATDIFNSLPYMVAVLNSDRQIIYANKALLGSMDIQDIEKALGQRPGEFFNCIHSDECTGGCGTSEYCRYCGAVNAILECIRTRCQTSGDCRITSQINNREVSFDLMATASPLTVNGKEYVVFSLTDISSEKRRRILERLFFHDIMNSASGLKGLLELLIITDRANEMKEYAATANRLTEDLIDEILAQKQLLAAETGELAVRPEAIEASSLLENIKTHLEHHLVAEGKTIAIHLPAEKTVFQSDPVILKRVLINLLKNALEASETGTTASMSYSADCESITFSVINPSFIPRETQLQIFQRSFSTKDHSRGLGTYSVKLLTEQYLKGKVDFESSEDTGTVFRIYLPLKYPSV